MASNPMQRKAKNSFILGMLLMAVIAAIIIGFLVMQLMNKAKEEQLEKATLKNVYVLSEDVKSGNVITNDMLVKKTIGSSYIPSNAWGDISMFDAYSLRDKEGNEITAKYDSETKEQTLYLTKNNKTYEVYKEEETDNYYIETGEDKEYIELDTVPLVAKIDLKANTVLTGDMIEKADSITQDDLRREEYNVVIMPLDLATGDYIDVRLMLNGQNYIVVSKKEVEIPVVDGADSSDTLWMNLSEGEILYMSDAIITAASVPGAKLYAVKYTEPGLQTAATPTYVVSESTKDIIRDNPNIVEVAKEKIRRNLENYADFRTNINDAINYEGDEATTNAQSGMQESMTTSINTRKKYLDALAAEASSVE